MAREYQYRAVDVGSTNLYKPLGNGRRLQDLFFTDERCMFRDPTLRPYLHKQMSKFILNAL
jgi:hypothetical protein